MRVLLVDDHAVVREGLKQILSRMPGPVKVGEAKEGSEALRMVREQDWDIVLLDLAMPGRGGLEVLKQLRQDKPRLPVLILSMFPEDQYAIRVLKAGASGYLNKESAPDKLLAAVQHAISGGKYVSPKVAEKLAGILGGQGGAPHEALSDREFQILRLIGSGKTVGVIAKELSLSVNTVSTYRTRLLEKLRLHNNAELTVYAINQRLLP